MTLRIPDEILVAAKLNEQQALIEFAAHLFDIDRLSLAEASRMAGLNRSAFEDELHIRGIAIYRYDDEDLRQDLEAFEKMKKERP